MEHDELKAFKREVNKQVEELKSEQKAFKRRVSIIANLLVPGIGFIIYGSSYLKGLLTFILLSAYNFFFFSQILNNTDLGVAVLYYLPALVIWIGSTFMVSSLDD
jgi:hypothetical protein